jgi:murein DD-endopeptidase MepM/ murein hydrolase activator NlpD
MADRLRPAALVRRVLLGPALAGGAALCLFLVLAVTGSPSAKDRGPLGGEHTDAAASRELVFKLQRDTEGTPTAADVRRAQVPITQRKRRLRAHPYYALYKAAKHRFGVSWFLVASVHYQETGFRTARAKKSTRIRKRDFIKVMAIASQLDKHNATDLGPSAVRAVAARYGHSPRGRLSAAMVIERARAWKLLGSIPLPGSGELSTPVKGTVGGCGYFGCPRPGHLHNGVDFLAPAGTPVHAADAGRIKIIQLPGASGGYGNFVCIQHRPHLASCYAHLSAFAPNLKVGHRVKRGEVIGLVGSTGSSTGPHLHFEVRRGPADCQTCAVDPMQLLDGKVPQDEVPSLLKRSRAAAQQTSAAPRVATAYVPPTPVAPAQPAAPPAAQVETAPQPQAPAPQPPASPPPAAATAASAPELTDAGGVTPP